jgi:hypothetical protein
MELNKIITKKYIYKSKKKEKREKKHQKRKKKLTSLKKTCYSSLRKAPISKPRLAKHKRKGITSFNNRMGKHINNSNKSAKEGTPTT